MDLTLELKGIRDEIIGRIDSGDTRHADLQKQVDAIDRLIQGHGGGGYGGGPEIKSFGQQFVESEEFQAAATTKFQTKKAITAVIENPFAQCKSTITNTSGLTAGVTGVSMPVRLPGINGLPQQGLRIRDLMRIRPMTTGHAFDFVRQTTRTNNASPVQETSPKAESTFAYESVSDTIKTFAHYVNVSRQALDDVPWLKTTLDGELLFGLQLVEETQILSGDGIGAHMLGLIPQATAYSTGYNVAGDTRIDKLRHAKLQARLAGLATFAPDGIVLNPVDMAAIELIKEENGGANTGLYIIGSPTTGPTVKLLWGLPVVESDSLNAGTFLVGAFGTAAEIIDRMAAIVEVSYEHSDNFTKNIATILCETRTGLACMRPSAFIFGSF